MEAFSLLKYWRGGGNASVNGPTTASSGGGGSTITATPHAVDMEDSGGGDDDDGPFFDLELAVPEEHETEENENEEESDDQNDNVEAKSEDGCSDDEREFNFTLSSSSSNDRSESDPNITLSPSDDLFFKGRLVSIEPDSCLDSKPTQFPVSLLKSATKFRVFMLRFKKSKLNSVEKTESVLANGSVSAPTATSKKQEENNNKNKSFTVKFKVEEVPIMSLFSRDNNKSQKQQKQQSLEVLSDEKKFTKDVMRKYLNKVKPLYVKVSRRYSEKKLSSLKPAAATPPSTAAQKSVSEKGQVVNIPAALRVACKHLGKSRSASYTVAAAAAASPPTAVLSNRRDDSLLQQEDGIQSAILHCKRSFNGSSRDSVLPRSVSDPSHESRLICQPTR